MSKMINAAVSIVAERALWRAGVQHPVGRADHPANTFTEEQLQAFRAEPALTVIEGGVDAEVALPETGLSAEQLTGATALVNALGPDGFALLVEAVEADPGAFAAGLNGQAAPPGADPQDGGRDAVILRAVQGLNREDASLFTKAGPPRVDAVEAAWSKLTG